MEEEDWQNNWKEHFYVLRISRRVTICPTWREHTPQEGEIVIMLEPRHGVRHGASPYDEHVPQAA